MGSTGDEKGKINVPTRTAFTNEMGQTVPSVKDAHQLICPGERAAASGFGAASLGWEKSGIWGDGRLHLASHEPAGCSERVKMCSDGVGMRMQVSLTAGLGIWRLELAGPGASSDFSLVDSLFLTYV